MRLVVCSRCQRHVRVSEVVCPFCGAGAQKAPRAWRTGAVAIAIGMGMLAPPGCAYGPPPEEPDAGDASVEDVDEAGDDALRDAPADRVGANPTHDAS